MRILGFIEFNYPMSISEFNDLASAIQSICLSLGILVGGVWALYQFFSLKTIETKKAELKALENSLQRKVTLEVSLKTDIFDSEFGKMAIVNVEIHNKGTHPECLDWERAVLNAHRMTSATASEIDFADNYSVGYEDLALSPLEIHGGNKESLKFVIHFPEKGLHHIHFSIPGAPQSNSEFSERLKCSGINNDADEVNLTYSADDYVIIE
jgi:hypothetical protein